MYALRNWYILPDKVLSVAERLKTVQIENRPALEVIRRFNYSDVFMYIDPTYLKRTKLSKRRQYKFEMTDEDHVELLNELLQIKAKVMISGYESDMYDDILREWNKEFLRSNNEYGSASREFIWMNY